MNLPFWSTLAYTKDRKDPLAGWQTFFRDQFPAVRTFLVPCPGEYARSYLHPERGLLSLRRFENRWAAYRADEDGEDYEDMELSDADVLLHRLDLARLRERLRIALGIDGHSNSVGPHLECLGRCTQGPEPRRVYWVASREDLGSAVVGAQEVLARSAADACVVMTSHHELTDRMLTAAGVSGVGLNERLQSTSTGFIGGCAIVCRHLPRRPDAVSRLVEKIDAGFERVRADRIAEAVAQQQQQETIEDMAEGADRFLAGLQARLTKTERELFLELVARKDTPAGPQVLGYTEIGKRLGITKQAVHKRLKALETAHPQAADYLRAIRDPAKPRNFSELSPTARRQEGVDEAYGYEADG